MIRKRKGKNDMNYSEYGEIINGEDTYNEIAEKLINRRVPVMIGWTDEECTHYDIMFIYGTYKPINNMWQGGLRPEDLFVAISRRGMFGFEINSNKLYPEYIAEKLFLTRNVDTSIEKVTELINGVKKSMVEVI